MVATLGYAFLGLAGFIFWKQWNATTCELHDRTAGQVAMALGVLVTLVGASLIIAATLL